MNQFLKKKTIKGIYLLLIVIGILLSVNYSYADITINIIAVNGTDKDKVKEIKQELPQDITSEDIISTGGLRVDYNVEKSAYYVTGDISLGPKESKTIKVIINDIWQPDLKKISEITEQIDISFKRLENTEKQEQGKSKQLALKKRLNTILEKYEVYADDTQKRIDNFHLYSGELARLRRDAISINFWRDDKELISEKDTFILNIDLENPSDKQPQTVSHKHFLPPEVLQEHILEPQGFSVRFDELTNRSYLSKEEELKPGERKRYRVTVLDVWNIPQVKINSLNERTSKAYKLLEKTEYEESARYLVNSIEGNLNAIELSQSDDKDIKEHISAFRKNKKRYEAAVNDVEALEDLLEAIREELERSMIKNVLLRIKSLNSIAEIAESIFKKPTIDTSWKIIFGVIIFVGILTIIHFTLWSKRSKNIDTDDYDEYGEDKDEEGDKKESSDKKAKKT